MSLESALDEERLAVMALLEGRSTPRPARGASPSRTQSPAATKSPVRSMLDVGDAPPQKPRRSMLDIGDDSPSTFVPRHSVSGSIGSGPRSAGFQSPSPYDASPHLRSSSRTPASPPPAGRSGLSSPSTNPENQYQFDMLPSIEAHAMPKRVTQGGKKKDKPQNPYEAAHEILGTGKDRGRHNSTSGIFGKHNKSSASPSSRLPGGRSQSPGGKKLNRNSMNLMSDPKKWVSDSGKVVDMDNAYRRLSDAALMRSGGTLSNLPARKVSDTSKDGFDGGVRLEKDYTFDEDDEDAVHSSDQDDDSYGSSGSEEWGSEKRRGRKRTRGKRNVAKDAKDAIDGVRTPRSLLAAAEDERKEVSSTYKVRSLLEPTVTVTGPDGEKMSSKKNTVHPHTNFDQAGSGVSTPMDSDVEAEISEIKRAQRMAMTISPIHSTPEANRCVRQVIRGEYGNFQEEAEQGLRRQRVYLVATDLSEEAAYALEWTIGTVLRDGDTLLACYAVDEEVGTGVEASNVGSGPSLTAADEARSLSKALSSDQTSGSPSPLHGSFEAGDAEKPPDFATMEKAERERWTATMEVSDRCVKLLRKTKLQVRVVVEVFHCKSPKHMLTEVIDFLEPTLVILGSRGRSALKGVLLGSFSNYLVTKSSVPVMVARKRLRKHSKYKRTNLRLSNVLSNPGKLVTAKVD